MAPAFLASATAQLKNDPVGAWQEYQLSWSLIRIISIGCMDITTTYLSLLFITSSDLIGSPWCVHQLFSSSVKLPFPKIYLPILICIFAGFACWAYCAGMTLSFEIRPVVKSMSYPSFFVFLIISNGILSFSVIDSYGSTILSSPLNICLKGFSLFFTASLTCLTSSLDTSFSSHFLKFIVYLLFKV